MRLYLQNHPEKREAESQEFWNRNARMRMSNLSFSMKRERMEQKQFSKTYQLSVVQK